MKIGLMGAGVMGSIHAEILNRIDNIELTALLEIDTEKAAKIIKKTGCKLFKDADAFFEKGDFDAVDICLPTFLHEEMILKSLKSTKHVLCEKPLTLSVESAKRIRDSAIKTEMKLMVAQVIRFWPQYRKIREMINKGEIGEIETIYAYRLSETPTRGNWFRIPEKGGGALYDFHIHDLDFVYALLGKPKSLYSAGVQGEFGAWDSISTILDYEGKNAVIQNDWCYPKGFPLQFGIRIKGNKGALEYRFAVEGNVESISKANDIFTLTTDGRIKEINITGCKDGYEEEIIYFIDCINSNKPIGEPNIEDALEVLELVEEEKASLETGKRRKIM